MRAKRFVVGSLLIGLSVFCFGSQSHAKGKSYMAKWLRPLAKINPIVHEQYGKCKLYKWKQCKKRVKIPNLAIRCRKEPRKVRACKRLPNIKRKRDAIKKKLKRLGEIRRLAKGKERRVLDTKRSRLIKKLGPIVKKYNKIFHRCRAHKLCYKMYGKKIKAFKKCFHYRVKKDCFKP